MKPFTTIAIVIFAIISIVHVVRLFTGWPVTVNSFEVPIWFSGFGAIVFGFLAIMVWRESKR